MKRSLLWLCGLLCSALLLVAGCSAFDEQQSRWVFQPSKLSWNGGMAAAGIDDVRIDFRSRETGSAIELHALWLPQAANPKAPLMLYLHGARWDVRSSATRMRRMQAMGFAVLGIDYRGFGQSTDEHPTENRVAEDARAAWEWLGTQHPGLARYVYGHSLGSAIAVRLADEVPAGTKPTGLILEGAFPSIPALLTTFRYGWLPLGPLVTQRFDAERRIARLKVPLLMLHGDSDGLVPPALGQELFAHANEPKQFVLVEGGSHHNASGRAGPQVQQALSELFGLPEVQRE